MYHRMTLSVTPTYTHIYRYI